MERNYEEDIKIDPNALDVEWLRQPQLFLHYAQQAAYSRETLDKAKELLDVARAELAGDIRNDHESYGLSKLTEGAINEVLSVTLHPNPEKVRTNGPTKIEKAYREANETFNKAKTDAELTAAAVRAFDQRKVALENLVRLHGQSYFAGPREPRDLNKEYSYTEKAREEASHRASEKVAESMTGRRRRG